jgi:hypothetical protein
VSKSLLPLAVLLIAQMHYVRAEEPRPATNPSATAAPAEEPWKAEIRKRLKKPVSFEFVDTPLVDAIKFLDSQTHVTIILDPKAMADGADKIKITLRVQDMELGVALDWVTKLTELEYDLKNQAVFIGKNVKAQSPFELQLYDISDLTHPKAGGADPVGILTNLVDAIKSIRPESWDTTRGASIEESNGKLVILQLPEIHKRIHELLAAKRGEAPAEPAEKPAHK